MNGPSMPANSGRGCLSILEGRLGTILVLMLVPLLLCVALVLPPISLPSRIMSVGYVNFAVAGAEAKDADGTIVRIPQGAVAKGGAIKISAMTQQAFAASDAGKSLPANLEAKSPYYTLDVQGERPKEIDVTTPIPNDAEPYTTLDLWARYGATWFKIPFTLNTQDQVIESTLNFVPDGMVVVQTTPQTPLIGAVLTSKDQMPADAKQVLAELNPTGLHLADEGAVAGDALSILETSASSPYAIVPSVSNTDNQGVRTDLTQNMLADDAQGNSHIHALVDLAVQRLYAGYNIQYDGLTSADQPAYTAFIKELAKQLHAQNKILSVTLPSPRPVAEGQWDTAGYDWALIGRYADEVKIPLLADAKAYDGESPLIDQYLQWATGQIDRNKLQVIVSTIGEDEAAGQYTPVPMGIALKRLGAISLPQSSAPGDKVLLDLPKLREVGGIQHHQPTGMFYFNYKDDKGTTHTIWLEDADSAAKKTALLMKYNLRGLTLATLAGEALPDPRIWTVLQQYHGLQASAIDSKISVVWLVDGQVLGKVNSNDPKLTLTVPNAIGQHTIDVALSLDDGQTWSAGGSQVAVNVLQPTPTPTPQPTQTPTSAPVAKPTRIAGVQPTKAPAPSGPPPASVGVNRFGYGMQLNWTSSPLGNDGEFGTLNGMGFGWAKIQVRWCDMQGSPSAPDTSALDNMNAIAKAHGIKLLFSIVCGPGWAGGRSVDGNPGPPDDPNQLGQIMSGLAGKYCPASGGALGAIEVWNETNLSREWGPRPLNGADYLNYLKVAYTAIKAACPSIVVVSGAPTPTGVSNANAIPDDVYLQQMYGAGLKQYSDAIGIHPSGYNVPVDCNITDASCTPPPGTTYMAPWQSRHYSFSFLSMMTRYRNIMLANGDGAKQLWATEFGWGVTGNPFPGYEYEKDNTPDEQAQWLVGAYRHAKQWGWVGVMFVWNLDFTSGENGAFTILNRPAQAALTNMPK